MDIKISDAFRSFTREKALISGSRTIDHYNDAYNHFSKAVKCSKKISDLSVDDLVSFVTKLKNKKLLIGKPRSKKSVKPKISNKKLSASSQSSYSRQINTFINFCVRRKWLAENPFSKDIFPKEPDKEITVFSDSQIEEIFKVTKKNNKKLYVALNLLSMTGFRISALVSLKMTDIDFEKNVIKLYNSKTKSYNEFPLYDQLKNFIKKNVPADGYEGYLLPYRHRGGIHKVFYHLRHKLGMRDPNTYNLHTFRKYFITKLLEKGLPIFDVSKLAHHKNIKTTMRYYAKVETGKLCDKLNELMPVAKKKKPKAA